MEDNFVKCRDGKEREIFPMLLKDMNKVRHFSVKFRTDCIIMNIMTPKGGALTLSEDKPIDDMFSDEAYNAMMEILVLAFGEKYTAEEIASWLDVAQVYHILDVFYGVSELKKKVTGTNPPIGI